MKNHTSLASWFLMHTEVLYFFSNCSIFSCKLSALRLQELSTESIMYKQLQKFTLMYSLFQTNSNHNMHKQYSTLCNSRHTTSDQCMSLLNSMAVQSSQNIHVQLHKLTPLNTLSSFCMHNYAVSSNHADTVITDISSLQCVPSPYHCRSLFHSSLQTHQQLMPTAANSNFHTGQFSLPSQSYYHPLIHSQATNLCKNLYLLSAFQWLALKIPRVATDIRAGNTDLKLCWLQVFTWPCVHLQHKQSKLHSAHCVCTLYMISSCKNVISFCMLRSYLSIWKIFNMYVHVNIYQFYSPIIVWSV